MVKLIKPRSKYYLTLIERVHDENEGIKEKNICELTKTLFLKYIKEIIDSDKRAVEINQILDLLALKTTHHSIVDVRLVENKCNPDIITERGKLNINDNIGLVIPENQYQILQYKYGISTIPNPVELILKGNFNTKDRYICVPTITPYPYN